MRVMQKVQELRVLWLTIGVVVLGVLLGLSLVSSWQNLIVSAVVILVHLVTIIASPLNGLLLWVVTNPFGELYVTISLGQSVPDLSLARFCVIFLAALLLAQTAIRKRNLVSFTTADMMCILFMFGLSFSAVNDYSDWKAAIQYIFDLYYIPLLVYFFAKNLVTCRQDLNKVLGAVLFFAVYAGLYAIYENQTGNILFFGDTLPTFTSYTDSGLHVLRGLLNRSNHFGALFSIVIPVNFYLYLKAQTSMKKGLYAITLGILFIGIYFTYKRTAWIAIVVSFFVIQWFYPQFRRFFFALLFVFLVVLGVTWNTVSESTVVTGRINTAESNVEGRTDGWNAAIDLWSHQPIFGYGVGNYEKVARSRGVDDTALESEHVRILFGTGLLGFLPYVAWFIFMLRDSVRLYHKSRQTQRKELIDWDLIVIFWGVFLGYIINYSATVANVFSVTMVFYLLAGAIVGAQTRFLVLEKPKPVSTVHTVDETCSSEVQERSYAGFDGC